VFPEERAETPLPQPNLDSALEAERTMLQKELTREINGETEFTGACCARCANRTHRNREIAN